MGPPLGGTDLWQRSSAHHQWRAVAAELAVVNGGGAGNVEGASNGGKAGEDTVAVLARWKRGGGSTAM